MLKRFNVGLVRNGVGRLALSSAFVTQLETAFQRAQRGTKPRVAEWETHEHRKARPTAKRITFKGIAPWPFYRLRVGGIPLKKVGLSRKVIIPDSLVRKLKLTHKKRVMVVVDNVGESIAVPNIYHRPKGIVTNTATSQYSLGFPPSAMYNIGRLWQACKAFVTRKYYEHAAYLKRNPSFHRGFFVRLFFAAKPQDGDPDYFVTSTAIYIMQKSKLNDLLDDVKGKFDDMLLSLSGQSGAGYEWYYMAGISYYTHGAYVKGGRVVMA